MRYGFVIPTGGPRGVAGLAREIEESGCDGASYWNGISVGEMDTYDPWVVMAAMAMRTERVRIGSMLTPPARRRPWKLAREAPTLDHLSGGRLVLPVGLGATDDGGFSKVGEPLDRRIRAQRLDEGLEIRRRRPPSCVPTRRRGRRGGSNHPGHRPTLPKISAAS